MSICGPRILAQTFGSAAKTIADRVMKTCARNDADLVVKTFKESEKLDKGMFDPVRILNIPELGIGFNPKIWKSVGYVLTDEKVTGTVHVAFGLNSDYGGTSQSVLHWDFVSAHGMNIEIDRSDGKTARVMTEGKFG
jgi:aminopeptidase